MSRTISAVPILLLLLPLSPLTAQTEEVTVKIEVNNRYQRRYERILTGTLLEPQAHCISIRTDRQGERCIPVDSVKKISVAVGRRRNAGRAALAGGAVGAVLGALIGAASASSCQDTGALTVDFSCNAGFGAMFGGFGGLMLGASIGGFSAAISAPSPIWRDADPTTFTRRGPRVPPVTAGLRVEF